MNQELENLLPKDLMNIINDYSKDRTNYDIVMLQLEMQSDVKEEYWFMTFKRKNEFRSKIFWASDKLKKEYENR